VAAVPIASQKKKNSIVSIIGTVYLIDFFDVSLVSNSYHTDRSNEIVAIVDTVLSFSLRLQDMFKCNINKYKNRTSVNENQLIKDLFTQTIEERRLKRILPEDLLDEA
jgi:hypothetical protein